MDQKAWLWRKKATEKIILATDKVKLSVQDNEEEIPGDNRRGLENELKILNNKLSSALSDRKSKDELVKKHEKMAMEAVVGKEKVEAEAVFLKRERDEALQKRVACEERLTHVNAALNECMQQLRFVREEQERRIHDAVMNASKEFEKSQTVLDAQLVERSKRVTKLEVENSNLSMALLAKEKLIDDLNKQRAQMETDFDALKTRVEFTEKENTSLKYEVQVLEKELEIRNEEREFNRRTTEASHKQHLESVKKIAKLESECQRLRLLVRKRLPGPAALAKMRNEVEMLGKDSNDIRRKLPVPTGSGLDFAVENYSDSPRKRINILNEQLRAMEEENKALKEALTKKTSKLQFSTVMYPHTASKLLQVESQFDEESSKSEENNEATRNLAMSHVVSLGLASMSDVGSDDKASYAESSALALISEPEPFRNRELKESVLRKTVGSPEIKLMDDFVEMEKLALVSADQQLSGNSYLSSDESSRTLGPLQTGSSGSSLEVMCKEIVPVTVSQSNHSMLNNEMKSESSLIREDLAWLRDTLNTISNETRATQRNPDKILQDIRKALAWRSYPNTGEIFYEREGSDHPKPFDPSCIGGYISWKPAIVSSKNDSSNGDADANIYSEKTSDLWFHPDLTESVCSIIELIEGIGVSFADNIPESLIKERNSLSYKQLETPTGYTVRVFQWKTSELGAILQQFVLACHELLNRKIDLKKFTQELAFALDWIINHSFSLHDVSTMNDEIKKYFDWDESRSESEAEVGIVRHFAEANKPHLAVPNGKNNFLHTKEPSEIEEIQKLRAELIKIETAKKYLEDKLQSTANRSESLSNQLEESKNNIASLQAELDTFRRTEEMVEGQVEKHKSTNQYLDNQLLLTKLESEPDNKNHCNDESEVACLDSVKEKEISSSEIKQNGKQFRTDWEIAAASDKLAECQETILNLGKQLKALASPKEAVLFENVVSAPTEIITPTTTAIPALPRKTLMSQRSSLLDQMIAEDNAETKDLVSSKAKENGNPSSSFISEMTVAPLDSNGDNHQDDNAASKSLAIVPSKKQGGSLWKKLLWRKTKSKSKKTSLPFAP